MQSPRAIAKVLNGYPYYTCSQCLFITLDKNEISTHLQEQLSCVNRCKKRQVQCFGCQNEFFNENSLLSHAINDHQMTEFNAKILLTHLTAESINENRRKPPAAKEPKEPRILTDLRIASSCQKTSSTILKTRNPDISGSPASEFSKAPDPKDSDSIENEYINPKTEKLVKSKKLEKCRKKKETTIRGYKCSLDNCNVRLLAQENILYHEKCHNEMKHTADVFRCPECTEFLADNWSKMAGHLWRLHLVDMELHTCEMCNYKTPSLSKLINQHRGIHGEERPFICEYCGKGFKTSKQLRSHKSSHKIDDTQAIECDKCQRIFKNFRLLKLHNNTVHKDCKPFTCNFCDYSASTRSGLKLHLRRHTGEKPFSCDQCAYSTGDHNSLRRHKLRHLGLKPYNCPHCSYACIQSSTYKVHLKSKHPGLDDGLMFSCQHCSYRSLNQGNLLTHSAKHTESTVNCIDK